MKKLKFLTLFLVLLCLFSTGCAKENPDGKLITEYEGKCSIYMTIDEYGFYHPQVVGWVALKTIPNKITLVCSEESFELNIKAVNPSTNGLYVLNFKQEHVFEDLEKGDNPIHLLIQIGDKQIEIKDFDLFICDDDYVGGTFAYMYDIFDEYDKDLGTGDSSEASSSGVTVIGMEKTWWWSPPIK